MFDVGVKANHTDPLFEHPLGSLGSKVAWLVSSVVENGRLPITMAVAKSSLLGCASAAGAGSTTSARPIVAATTSQIRRRVLDAATSASARRAGRLTATTPLCCADSPASEYASTSWRFLIRSDLLIPVQ